MHQCYESAAQNGHMSATELAIGQNPALRQDVAVPEAKVRAAIELLRGAVQEHGKVVYSNSLGAESMVLTDLIWTHVPQIEIFSIDTGRLHEETYQLLERIERRYQRRIRLYYPDPASLEAYTAENGINGFYMESIGPWLFSGGRPRPSLVWQPSQDTRLNMGPSPSKLLTDPGASTQLVLKSRLPKEKGR